MSQTAKAQEPSMEEILASIRRIIFDDDATKTTKAPEPLAPKPVAPQPQPPPPPVVARPAPPPPPAATANRQSDINAMLADLDKPKPALRAEPAKPPSPPPSPSNDVLDLTEAMASPSPSPGPAPTFRTIDGDSNVVFADRPMDAPRAEEPRRPPVQMPMPDPGLLSNATAAAVDSAFNTLAATVLGQNARTLEDLVKEMLRPMLKSWLDDNLPGLVERIVRAEIERVSRGKP
jgi:cell pole-organizing protein PopZ